MTSSPWWIPLGAAAIALLGVVVGQALGAVIETRRNRRETKQRAFEYWREKRFDAYTEFVRCVDHYAQSAMQFAVLLTAGIMDENDPDLTSEGEKRLIREHNNRYEACSVAEQEDLDEVQRTFAELQILASNVATYKQFNTLTDKVLEVNHILRSSASSEQKFKPDEIMSIAEIAEMIPEVLMAVRAELGIKHD